MFTKHFICTVAACCLLLLVTACQQLSLPQGQYQQLNNDTTLKPLRLSLQDNRLTGFTGCNNMIGNYSIDEGSLVVSQLASTMMACSEPLMQREQAFSSFLQGKPKVTFNNNVMTLRNDDAQYQFELL